MKNIIKNLHSNDKGITLIEVIIALSILTLVSGAALTLMQLSTASYNRQNDEVNEQQNLRKTMNYISKYIMEGNSTIVHSSSELRIDSGKYRIYLENTSDGKFIRLEDKSGATSNITTISNPVSNFIVAKPDLHRKAVNITIVDKNQKYQISTTITPRN